MNKSLLPAVTLLAFASQLAAQQLLCVDSARRLYVLEAATGARTQIATITSNAGTSAGLAHDITTGTTYLTSSGNDAVYRLDLATGTATLIGAYGDSTIVMHGLEWDLSTGTLYGVSSHNNGLYTIDTTTGVASLVGTSTLTSFTNLGYDRVNDVMYATNSGTDSFYRIDRATGAATLIGPLNGPTNPHGLAYDYGTGTMYLVCSSTDTLYTIDLATGAATAVGPLGSGNYLGLAFVRSSWREFGTGCAGSAGTPTLTTTGLPISGSTLTTQIGSVPAGSAAWGVIGFSDTLLAGAVPLPLDLTLIGMPGCEIHVDIVLSVPLGTAGGTVSFPVLLPPNALGLTLFEQGYVLDPGANTFGLTVTNGAEAHVGL